LTEEIRLDSIDETRIEYWLVDALPVTIRVVVEVGRVGGF